MNYNNFSERYINLRKNKDCFKQMKNTKELIPSKIFPYFSFYCSKLCTNFMVSSNKELDIEYELIKFCDKKCNINSKNLELFYPNCK